MLGAESAPPVASLESRSAAVNILYYNLQLGSFDGSNAHAVGMLDGLRAVNGASAVLVANDVEALTYDYAEDVARRSLGKLVDPLRMLRRRAIEPAAATAILERTANFGFRPDVILARSSVYDYVPLRVARSLGCDLILEYNTPFVYECCELRKGFIRPCVRRFEARLVSDCCGIYCVSEVLAQMLVDDYGVARDRLSVIPNGYSGDLYEESGSRESIRAETRGLHGVHGKRVVTFVGSLQEWHGIPHLLELAEAYAGRSDLEFWIVGDGILREAVRRYAETHANLKWFGGVSPVEVRDILYASDLGIMPYDPLEFFYFSPLKMYEMIGAGLPFIATSVGQISELCTRVLDRGFLFEHPSVAEMSAALEAAFDAPSRLADMAELVRASSRGRSWLDRAAQLTAWMDSLVNAGGCRRAP